MCLAIVVTYLAVYAGEGLGIVTYLAVYAGEALQTLTLVAIDSVSTAAVHTGIRQTLVYIYRKIQFQIQL